MGWNMRAYCFAVLLVAMVLGPASGMADDGGQADEDEVAQQTEEEAAEEEVAEPEEGDEATAEQEEAATPEQAEGDREAVDEDGEVSEGDEEETVEGPGGRELRTDYPGTEESLQERMETGRIEGMDVPEGEDPEEVYDLRVRELETQIDDLKERVFRSKSRIALLRETVLAENLAGSRAVVTFEDDLGTGYQIERMVLSVDGNRVYSEVDPNGDLSDGVEVFSGPMTPGTHTVSAILGLRGSSYGVFRYAEGYEFELRFSCQFTAEEGRTTLVTVRSYESGNVFTAHEDRPDGICEVSMVELTVDDLEDEPVDMPDEELPELE